MLAPRKKLWSTPQEVVEKAIEMLKLQSGDVCFDVGAGDGRFLLRYCEICPENSRCIGVEIEEERCLMIQNAVNEGNFNGKCAVICGNATEQNYEEGTCFFMYLIPRGLKVMLKVLQENFQGSGRKLRVVTYMSPFPAEVITPIEIQKVSTAAHPEAEWPLYLYEIDFS